MRETKAKGKGDSFSFRRLSCWNIQNKVKVIAKRQLKGRNDWAKRQQNGRGCRTQPLLKPFIMIMMHCSSVVRREREKEKKESKDKNTES